jgi:hypothetical protein
LSVCAIAIAVSAGCDAVARATSSAIAGEGWATAIGATATLGTTGAIGAGATAIPSSRRSAASVRIAAEPSSVLEPSKRSASASGATTSTMPIPGT